MKPSEDERSAKAAERRAREERLARALRANLKRRKVRRATSSAQDPAEAGDTTQRRADLSEA